LKNINNALLFESAFKHASIGMALVALDGKWLKVNNSLCELLRYSENELLSKTFQDITHPEDLEIDLQNVQNILDKKSDAYEIEKRYFDKSGNIIWVILSVSVVRDEVGDFQFFISQIRDITKRKKYFQELFEEKQRIENILEGTHAGTWEWNVKTGETRFNDYWANIIGYTLKELEPVSIDTWAKLTHPDDLALSNKNLEDYFAGKEEVYYTECRMKHKNGHWVWIMDRGKIVSRDTFGNPEWVFGTHIKIDELKKTQQKLQETTKKFVGIFNSAYQFMGFLDTSGVLLEANQTALDFAGISLEDVINKPFWETYWWKISKETQQFLKASVEKAAAGEIVHYEAIVWDKNKAEVPILFNLKPVKDSKGKVIYIIAEGRPIQEVVEIRNQLIAKNSELENFAHIAAHDLKEPTNAISGLAHLILKKEAQNLSPKSLTFLNHIHESSKRMTSLISEILTYSQVSTRSDQWKQVDLNITLQETISYLKTMIEDEHAKIIVRDLPTILGNETALKILFQNLLVNALKYRKEKVNPVITIDYQEVKDEVIIRVRDNGIGIEEENFKKIFDKFVKINKDRKYKSSGLGLATCRKIVENHMGRIWLESEFGKGTTFFIAFHQ